MKQPQQRLLRYELISLARKIDRIQGRHHIYRKKSGRGTVHTRIRPTNDPLRMLYNYFIVPEVQQDHPDNHHANVCSGTLNWINCVCRDIKTMQQLNHMHGDVPADHRFLNIVRLHLKQMPASTLPGKRVQQVMCPDERYRLYHYLETLRPARTSGYRHFMEYECHYSGDPLQLTDLFDLFVLVNDHQRALNGCYIYSGVEVANIQWACSEMSHELDVVDARSTPEVVRDADRRHFELKFGTRAKDDMVAYWTAIMRPYRPWNAIPEETAPAQPGVALHAAQP